MAQYLKHFPQPFLDDLAAGRCVPFVGAGFSRNARTPPDTTIPLWDKLGRQLAGSIPDYEHSSALDSISAYAHEYARAKLLEELHKHLLVDVAQPGPAHLAFCATPFELVVTTNFDFLLERGYETTGRYCRPIIDEEQLAIDSSGPRIQLLKLHGDLHHPHRLVATEEDYDAFLDRFPLLATFLANLLIGRTAFFIGYSLDDPDFRQVWQIIGDRLGKLRRLAYVIAIDAPRHTTSRFERRGVKVVNLPGKPAQYPEILQQVFEELREYWLAAVPHTSTFAQAESQAELTIPKNARNRLCFFSVPVRLAAFYKAAVYPLAESYGFAPVMPSDILSAKENLTAAITALQERAELLVIDVASPQSLFDLEYSIAGRIPGQRILLIAEKGVPIPVNLRQYEAVLRPADPTLDDEGFVEQVERWFSLTAAALRGSYEDEPLRLLNMHEYRAAVISAVSLLENELRERLAPDLESSKSRYVSIARLFTLAASRQLILTSERKSLLRWLEMRNRLAHTTESVSARQARTAVQEIMAVVEKIRGAQP